MSDNSALQCIGKPTPVPVQVLNAAVILPRVQTHFNLSHEIVGLLSACTMAGVSYPTSAVRELTADDDWRGRVGDHLRPPWPGITLQLDLVPYSGVRHRRELLPVVSYPLRVDVLPGQCGRVSLSSGRSGKLG